MAASIPCARGWQTVDTLRRQGIQPHPPLTAVNHRAIDHISYLPSGDGEITLRNGKVLSRSRRYKDEFKQQLG